MANKVMLLGSDGYIGSFIRKNFDVIPVSRVSCDFRKNDEVRELLRYYLPDVVINCAVDKSNTIECEHNNLDMFYAITYNNDLYGKYITFGSGAEFDRSRSINLCDETELFSSKPKNTDYYGRSKNLISKLCFLDYNSYVLRLFGAFYHTDKGLFNNLLKYREVVVEDRMFDYFYLEDLIPVLDYFIKNDSPIKDVNLVYKEKRSLRELAEKFKEMHSLETNIIYKPSDKNYTGSSTLLDKFGFEFKGLDYGLKHYVQWKKEFVG